MTEAEQKQLQELRGKSKLTAPEKSVLKALERKLSKANKNSEGKPKRNETFGVKPTTKLATVPFRMSEPDKKVLTDTRLRIEGTELFYDRLGNANDLSNNMQMRAAIWAYEALSDEDKVEYIRKAKLAMVRFQD